MIFIFSDSNEHFPQMESGKRYAARNFTANLLRGVPCGRGRFQI